MTTETIPPEDVATIEARSTELAQPGARVIELADPGWCWSRLSSTARGVLSADGSRSSAGRHVGFTLDDLQIVVPVAADDEGLHRLADRDVTLSLAGRGDDGLRWVVRVTGVALLLLVGPPVAEVRGGSRGGLRPRDAAPALAHQLLLPIDRVRGYRETLSPTPLATTTTLTGR